MRSLARALVTTSLVLAGYVMVGTPLRGVHGRDRLRQGRGVEMEFLEVQLAIPARRRRDDGRGSDFVRGLFALPTGRETPSIGLGDRWTHGTTRSCDAQAEYEVHPFMRCHRKRGDRRQKGLPVASQP